MPKTEKEILDQIPDTWADDISEAELNVRAEQIFHITTAKLAEGTSLSSIHPPEKIIASVLSGMGKDEGEGIAELQAVSVMTAKMLIFNERYGHMFPKNTEGELSMSPAMFTKITGEVITDDKSDKAIESCKVVTAAPSSLLEQLSDSKSSIRLAYMRWMQTPYPFFPWQKKKRKKVYQAMSEFIKMMIRFMLNFWKINRADLDAHLANLCSFSALVTNLGTIETFVVARPIKTCADNQLIKMPDPFMAPKVLLRAENAAALLTLIEMLEATFAYRLEDNIRHLRDSLRNRG